MHSIKAKTTISDLRCDLNLITRHSITYQKLSICDCQKFIQGWGNSYWTKLKTWVWIPKPYIMKIPSINIYHVLTIPTLNIEPGGSSHKLMMPKFSHMQNDSLTAYSLLIDWVSTVLKQSLLFSNYWCILDTAIQGQYL